MIALMSAVFEPTLLLLVPVLIAAGVAALTLERSRERWIEERLEQVPGEDRRAKLIALALHTDLPKVAAAARRLLDAGERSREAAPAADEGAGKELERVVEGEAAAEAPVAAEQRRFASARSVEAVARALRGEESESEAEAEAAETEPEAAETGSETETDPEAESETGSEIENESETETGTEHEHERERAPRAARPPIDEALRRAREELPTGRSAEGGRSDLEAG